MHTLYCTVLLCICSCVSTSNAASQCAVVLLIVAPLRMECLHAALKMMCVQTLQQLASALLAAARQSASATCIRCSFSAKADTLYAWVDAHN
jgi:uncharacterized protein YunC (DUF1805 family)